MDTSNIPIAQFINTWSVQRSIEDIIRTECAVEASAAQSEEMQEKLSRLADGAYATVITTENTISISIDFADIPEGMEDYAEMIRANVVMVANSSRGKDVVTENVDTQKIAEYIAPMVADELQTAIKGGG